VGQTILLVDDALYMRTVLKKILAAQGFDILEAANGAEAVASCLENNPDLVLMDITMPEMDGIAATKAICEAAPDAKIVICSALGQQRMVVEATTAGASDYITKPFQPDEVLAAVQRNLAA